MMERIEQIVAEAQHRAQQLVDALAGHGDPDGCAVDMTKDPTPDEDVDGVVLFAGVDPVDVDDHAKALRALLEEDDRAS